MPDVTIIGIDIARNVFQFHGATATGRVAFRQKLSRRQLLDVLQSQPPALVVMEACATARHWGREILKPGHNVRLIPPICVKPFVKRQKTDAHDAKAIAEAASRPTMRFVAVKGVEDHSQATLFRARSLLVAQRSQLKNALRAHLAEYGVIAPAGAPNVYKLIRFVGPDLPADQIKAVTHAVSGIEPQMKLAAKDNPVARRLQTMPGVGPMTAAAIGDFALPSEAFKNGRDFAVWVGLVPRHTGGKTGLGGVSKMGQQDIRRLLIIGAIAVVRWALRKPPRPDSWLAMMLARKPRMPVAIALANKMAREIRAIMRREEDARAPAAG
jgi:transposase